MKGARGIVESRSESFIPVTERGARPKKGKNEEREFVSWIFLVRFFFVVFKSSCFPLFLLFRLEFVVGAELLSGKRKEKKGSESRVFIEN